jgi:hypothetical protein
LRYERYDTNEGDIIDFCCDRAREAYPNTIGYEGSDEKFAIYSVCKGEERKFNHYISYIEYCPFCGKKINEEKTPERLSKNSSNL